MNIDKFKNNSIFIVSKVIKNLDLLLYNDLKDVDVIQISSYFLIIRYIKSVNFCSIVRQALKEPNLQTYSFDDDYIVFTFNIAESKNMRVSILLKRGYDDILKSEIVDMVLFFREHSINIIRYYEKTLVARESSQGLFFSC